MNPIELTGAGEKLRLRLFLTLFLVECLLLLADLTLNFGGWTELGPVKRFFNIAREDGVASWFQVSQTLLVALTLWLIVALSFAAGFERVRRWGWLLLALFYTFLCFDDGAQFHERVGSVVELRGQSPGSSSVVSAFPTYHWHLALGPLFFAVGVGMLWFVLRELRAERRNVVLFLLGMAAMGVAQVLDFFEGMRPDSPWNPLRVAREWLQYSQDDTEHLSRAGEEMLEMYSMTCFWIAYLGYLLREFPRFSVRLDAD